MAQFDKQRGIMGPKAHQVNKGEHLHAVPVIGHEQSQERTGYLTEPTSCLRAQTAWRGMYEKYSRSG